MKLLLSGLSLLLLTTSLYADPSSETPASSVEPQEQVEKPVFTPWVEPDLDLGLCDS